MGRHPQVVDRGDEVFSVAQARNAHLRRRRTENHHVIDESPHVFSGNYQLMVISILSCEMYCGASCLLKLLAGKAHKDRAIDVIVCKQLAVHIGAILKLVPQSFKKY